MINYLKKENAMKNDNLEDKTTFQGLPPYAQFTRSLLPSGAVRKQKPHDKDLLSWCDEILVAQKLTDFFVE